MKQFSKILVFLVLAVFLMAGSAFAYSISYTDDYWTLTDLTTGTQGDATFVITLEAASYESDFGVYYLNGNTPATYKVLDKSIEASDSLFQNVYIKYDSITSNWVVSLDNSIWTKFSNTFGFYFGVYTGGVNDTTLDYTWYTDKSLNKDSLEHIRTLRNLTGDNVTIYLDDQYGGGDRDFNDMIVSGIDVKPVPEPATMLLFGTGLIGIAALGRKKIIK